MMDVPVLEVVDGAADERRGDRCNGADRAEVNGCARLDVRGFGRDRGGGSERGGGGGSSNEGDDGGRAHDDLEVWFGGGVL